MACEAKCQNCIVRILGFYGLAAAKTFNRMGMGHVFDDELKKAVEVDSMLHEQIPCLDHDHGKGVP